MSAQLARGDRGGSGGDRDDASSTGSERLYEQDIAILNRYGFFFSFYGVL